MPRSALSGSDFMCMHSLGLSKASVGVDFYPHLSCTVGDLVYVILFKKGVHGKPSAVHYAALTSGGPRGQMAEE